MVVLRQRIERISLVDKTALSVRENGFLCERKRLSLSCSTTEGRQHAAKGRIILKMEKKSDEKFAREKKNAYLCSVKGETK